KKIKQFQDYYGLKVTGKANMVTQDKMDAVLTSPFQKGKRHEDTIQLKKDLNRLGFEDILVTSYFGGFSDKQVREFQDYYGLVENGIADDRTRAKVKEILSNPLQQGKR